MPLALGIASPAPGGQNFGFPCAADLLSAKVLNFRFGVLGRARLCLTLRGRCVYMGVKLEVAVAELERIDISAALRSGVYLLSRDGVVVYVGQSKCPLVRIYTHRSLVRKRVPAWLSVRGVAFDTAEVIPCHPDRINALEKALIEFYKPVCNKALNPEPSPYPAPMLKPPPKPNIHWRPL